MGAGGRHSVGRLNVTIRVTNVDEPGVVETNVEEPRVGQTVRLNVEDEDAGVNVREWKWERGEPNGSCGTVDSPTVTTWETISGARSSSYNADCGRIRAIASGRQPSTTTGQEQGGLSSSLRPTMWRSAHSSLRTRRPTGYRRIPPKAGHIGRVQARHSNSGEALTYRLSGTDARYFTIDDNAQLKTSATSLDYETRSSKDAIVKISAEDSSGQTDTISVTIAVTDVNEGPEISRVGALPAACGRTTTRRWRWPGTRPPTRRSPAPR